MAQFMHMPTKEHWVRVKQNLRYLRGTLDMGLLLFHNTFLVLHAFLDVDWAGNKDIYSTTSAYLVYLRQNLISWSSKNQATIARSSIEVGYCLISSIVVEIRWVCSLLSKHGIILPSS